MMEPDCRNPDARHFLGGTRQVDDASSFVQIQQFAPAVEA
jgi:hypothetical protein